MALLVGVVEQPKLPLLITVFLKSVHDAGKEKQRSACYWIAKTHPNGRSSAIFDFLHVAHVKLLGLHAMDTTRVFVRKSQGGLLYSSKAKHLCYMLIMLLLAWFDI